MTKELFEKFKGLEFSKSIKINFRAETLNGNELYLRSIAVANNLKHFSKKHIFYLGGKGINLLPIAYGTMLSGNYYTPLNNKDGADRLKKIINSVSNPVVIIENRNFKEFLGDINALLVSDIIEGDCALKFHHSTDKDIAYTIFTSGSTGFPKGVNILYESLSELIFWYSSYLSLDETSVASLIAQPHFDLSIPDIFAPIIYKGTLHIIPDEVILFPQSLVNFISENIIENIALVPTLFNKISENISSSHLKSIALIGEKFPFISAESLLKRQKSINIYNMYGPTEGCFCSSSHKFNPDIDSQNVPIGAPRCENSYKIVNSELHIGGKCVSSGYHNVNSESFYSDNGLRWYKTGDIVEYKDNNYYFHDRVDRQIQINGYRVELSEIEIVLSTEVNCNLAVISTDKLICYLESCCNIEDKISALKAVQKVKLPKYMRVSTFIEIDEFPTNSSGKIDYKKLIGM